MPATVEERMIRLWASSQGAWKSAMAGIFDPPQLTARPQRIPADVMTSGKNVPCMGKQQAGFDVPDPGRSRRNGNRHTRRKIYGRKRRGEKTARTLRVHVQRL
jgi:hypothetical protein